MKIQRRSRFRGLGLSVPAGVLALATTVGLGRADVAVHEPKTYHQGDLHGPTATTLMGATPPPKNELDTVAKTIGLSNLAKVAAKENPLLLDVSTSDVAMRPDYKSVPGAVLLVGAGSGTDDQAFMDAYKERIHTLTGGDIHKPIMVFSHPEDWSGYNAAKRLVYLGYKHIRWYRGGVEGWVKGGYPTAPAKPDQAWSASMETKH